MSPKLTSAVFLILITTTTAHGSSGEASDLIRQTCKKTPDYMLCVISLITDLRGRKAEDVRTLALVMINVVNGKATAASNEIKRLLIKSEPELKEPLMNCEEAYRVIIEDDVSVAIEAVNLLDPKFGEEAMNDAADESDACERGFDGGKRSPLYGVNKSVRNVADVASAIIRQY
ncbi:Cell wall / vacuolar inhibitor of fructosidase 1 [Linum perenne]